MTVSVTWSKQLTKRWLAPAVVLLLVGGCGGETPKVTSEPLAPEQPALLPEMPDSAASSVSIGLIPLPSVEEVQQAAPGGRVDPFARLSSEEGQDPTSGITLTGILTVGNQQRAFVTTSKGSGVICVGSDGRCGEEAPLVLPPGWSVLSIDAARRCVLLAQNDDPQDPLCIA